MFNGALSTLKPQTAVCGIVVPSKNMNKVKNDWLKILSCWIKFMIFLEF